MTQVVFLSHGGGPLPLLGDPNHLELIQHLRQLSQDLEAPKQILVISAHWEASVIQITHHSNPPLLYDYYGFPEQSYHLDYPVPGAPALAEAVQATQKTRNRCGVGAKPRTGSRRICTVDADVSQRRHSLHPGFPAAES